MHNLYRNNLDGRTYNHIYDENGQYQDCYIGKIVIDLRSISSYSFSKLGAVIIGDFENKAGLYYEV